MTTSKGRRLWPALETPTLDQLNRLSLDAAPVDLWALKAARALCRTQADARAWARMLAVRGDTFVDRRILLDAAIRGEM
jgi:hypothetical protein